MNKQFTRLEREYYEATYFPQLPLENINNFKRFASPWAAAVVTGPPTHIVDVREKLSEL